MRTHLHLLLFLTVCCSPLALAAEGKQPVRFDRDIRPILSNHCFHCHGPDEKSREADLRLDTKDGLFAELASGGHSIVPGKPEESDLYDRVSTDDQGLKMPPADGGKPLNAEQIELLKRWIEEGGEWRGHWAYEPIVRPPVPEVKDPEWQKSPIDRFVMRRLEAEGVPPVGKADSITLLRRLSLDLNGLIPDRELVLEFPDLSSEEAYQRLVTKLLDSPRYGERMAIYWLDLVRYADSCGYHSDVDQNVSPYRDYVINSFNRNLPFDEFTREQIAGDLLPNPTVDQKIATCFNRLNKATEEGGAQEGEYLAKAFADRVRTVSGTWLGATFGCAECHDHKFDPISTRDFYSFGAFFADVTENGVYSPRFRHAPDLTLPTPEETARQTELEGELSKLKEALKSAGEKKLAAVEAAKTNDGMPSETGETKDEKSAEVIEAETQEKELKEAVAKVETEIKNLDDQLLRVLITVPREPREIRILPRGDWLNKTGEIVEPSIPASFVKGEKKEGRLNRLDLVDWLVDRQNPLTARVFVNRMWKLFFGSGLSRNLEDLGFQGESPTHPELLDWLSAEFIESGWDVKHLVTLIVSSRTYQLSSIPATGMPERDPQNRLLSHQSRWRLEAEFLRDNALFVSGLLVEKIGGRSVKPYQPEGYWEFLNFPKRDWVASVGENQYRRGLYTHWQRTFLHPSMLAFDAPSREECTANRPTSNTPKAALALLNDPTFVESARVFAVRTLKEGGSNDRDRLHYAWVSALTREPEGSELTALQQLLDAARSEYTQDEEAGKKLVSVGQSPEATEFAIPELAAWTTISRAILNLHEFTTRN
ncbi:MAG: PSD1 domain-containing protein [Planctomycetaceae bacterium]|nr:PSD1 domain-containing protein [Planctomycetaceae bacterium]